MERERFAGIAKNWSWAGRTDTQWPRLEAESRGEDLGEGATSPLPTSKEVWGALQVPQWVRGGGPVQMHFWARGWYNFLGFTAQICIKNHYQPSLATMGRLVIREW